MKRTRLLGMLPLLLVAVVALVACGEEDEATNLPEQQLAAAGRDGLVPADDPQMARFASWLSTLEERCTQTRMQISDAVLDGQRAAETSGKAVSVEQVLSDLLTNTTGVGTGFNYFGTPAAEEGGRVDCVDVVTTLVSTY